MDELFEGICRLRMLKWQNGTPCEVHSGIKQTVVTCDGGRLGEEQLAGIIQTEWKFFGRFCTTGLV